MRRSHASSRFNEEPEIIFNDDEIKEKANIVNKNNEIKFNPNNYNFLKVKFD